MLKKTKRKKSWRVLIFLIINWVLIFALLVSYLSPFISPQSLLFPAFFGLAYPYLLVLNLIFMLVWIFAGKRYFIYSLLMLVIGINHPGKYFQFHGKSTNDTDIGTFRVLTYNIQNFAGNNIYLNRPVNKDEIIGYLNQRPADIICLQEFYIDNPIPEDALTDFGQQINRPYYKYSAYAMKPGSRFGGMVIFSKYPIINSFSIPKEDGRNLGFYVDLLRLQDTIRIFNVHLESIHFKHEDIDFITGLDLQDTDEQKIREGSRIIFGRLGSAFRKRANQAVNLKTYINQSPHPVIVCGDFNDTPLSYAYRKVSRKLEDAFIESGQGFGNTYSGRLPSYRIDYILYDPVFESFNYQKDAVKYSDHFPVSASFIKP